MMASATSPAQVPVAKPFYHLLYVQVLAAIVLGVIVGALFPALATNEWIKFLGDAFVKLIKMMIAPIIFCTIVSGIAHVQDAKKVGRVGINAGQPRPKPRGGWIAMISSRSRSTIACKASPVAPPRVASGKASSQAA